MQGMKNNKAFLLLQSLPLEPGEYAIFGSGIMFALGIRPLAELHDLDIVVSKSGWEKVKILGKTFYDPVWKCNWLKLFDEQIELFDGWGPGEWNVTGLISEAEIVDGFPFVNIENVIKWKKVMGREKDMRHIEIMEEYFEHVRREQT